MEEMIVHSNNDNCVEEEVLPGFRFHPTDEELVGFYLRRKVEKKPVRIELIKQIDIYKHDPWDLPKSTVGEKEMYFYCMRGRKYRNSIRPNRVTGSGYWKATGIDRQIYAADGKNHVCLGLKKSLVYYHGSAGKGTKTDWMMHEFRLPSNGKSSTNMIHEAEILTLCRIFKKNGTQKRYTFEETSSMKKGSNDPSTRTWSTDSDTGEIHQNSLNISKISEGKVSDSSQLDSDISYAVSSSRLSIVNHDELLFEEMLDDIKFVDYYTNPAVLYGYSC